MRRRQAYAQRDDLIRAQYVGNPEFDAATSGLSVAIAQTVDAPKVIEAHAPDNRCSCGRDFPTAHGLKIHKARCNEHIQRVA